MEVIIYQSMLSNVPSKVLFMVKSCQPSHSVTPHTDLSVDLVVSLKTVICTVLLWDLQDIFM